MRNYRKIANAKAGAHSYFTLIELLVVVAIIGILASILMPSLQRARTEALAKVCINNMRQITVMNVMYDDDYNSFPPGQQQADDYLVDHNGEASRQSWKCPVDKGTWNYGAGVPADNNLTTFEQQGTSYRWNYFAQNSLNGNGQQEGDISMSNVSETSLYVIVSSAAIQGTWGPYEAGDYLWHFPSKPKFPMAFIDGHAKLVTDARIYTSEPWVHDNGSPYVTRDN